MNTEDFSEQLKELDTGKLIKLRDRALADIIEKRKEMEKDEDYYREILMELSSRK